MARAVVAGVVGGGAVSDVVQPEVATDRLERFEELLFAVKAAIGVVASIRLELNFARRHLDEPCTQLPGQVACLVLLRLWIGGRAREDRDCILAQLSERELQQK